MGILAFGEFALAVAVARAITVANRKTLHAVSGSDLSSLTRSRWEDYFRLTLPTAMPCSLIYSSALLDDPAVVGL